MSKTKLPFELKTLVADRHFISVYPDNKQWLIVLQGTELGDKLCSLLKPSSEDENVVGLWLDKIHGLYQEERQLLEEQIEGYYNEKLEFQKYVATVAKALEVSNDEAINLLDDPYSDGLDVGEKLEPFVSDFREIALKLTKLESRLNEDAIAVMMSKRFGIAWTKEETEQLHEGMKKALSEFISNEQRGWQEESVVGSGEPTTNDKLNEGNDTPNPTGSISSTTSKAGQKTTSDSTT